MSRPFRFSLPNFLLPVSLALAACMPSATGASDEPRASAERIEGGEKFVDTFARRDTARWNVSHGWDNGPNWANDWQRSQVAFDDALTLTLDEKIGPNHRFASGEVQSRETYGHGYYETVMRAAPGSGVVTGFFTYTGPPFKKPWNEIDVEILGAEPTKLYATYFYHDKKVSQTIDLGFDATAAHHRYGFDWQPGFIRWYVDGELVHEADGSDVPIPDTAQKLMVHLWATETLNRWTGPFDPSVLPVSASYRCIAYSPRKPAVDACLSVGAKTP